MKTKKFTVSSNDLVDSVFVDIQFAGAVSGGTATGLANNSTEYGAVILVDNVRTDITVVGSTAQTITNLTTQIDNDLSGATATFSDAFDHIRIDHDTAGTGHSIRLDNVNLVSSLTAGGGASIEYPWILDASFSVDRILSTGETATFSYEPRRFKIANSTGADLGYVVLSDSDEYAEFLKANATTYPYFDFLPILNTETLIEARSTIYKLALIVLSGAAGSDLDVYFTDYASI